jgi:hypothetical protein
MLMLVEESSRQKNNSSTWRVVECAAYLKPATVENAISGFKCTGIIPLNPVVLPKSKFLDDHVKPPMRMPSHQSPTQFPTALYTGKFKVQSHLAFFYSTSFIPLESPTVRVRERDGVQQNSTCVSSPTHRKFHQFQRSRNQKGLRGPKL